MTKVDRNDAVDAIKNAVDIVEVVSDAIELKKKGRNYTACCPFHSEKTPSFMVSPDKQYFKCFGCDKGGDVFTFVQEYYGKTFPEALEMLAEKARIELVGGYGDDRSKEKKRLQQLNRDAAEYFFINLWKNDSNGYTYMAERGAQKEVLRDFAVGYAPWDEKGLYNFLLKRAYSEEEMIEAQLVKKYQGEMKDFFRNRIMFPIRDVSGKFIAFGGRDVLKPGEKAHDMRPKYLNTSDYFLFKKSKIIYGLYQAMETIRKSNFAILVEGYMDVIALHQYGFKNAVASMGTAFTEEQAALLRKHAKTVYLCYDSDQAGNKAAERGGMELKRQNMLVKVIRISDGKDPDDFIKKRGRRAFEDLMEEAEDYESFCIGNMAELVDFEETQSKVVFIRKVAGFLKRLDPAEQDVYAKETARKYPVSEQAIKRQIEAYRDKETARPNKRDLPLQRPDRAKEKLADKATLEGWEATILNMLYRNSDLREYLNASELRDLLSSPAGKAMFKALQACLREDREISKKNILAELDDQAVKQILLEKVIDAEPIKESNALLLKDIITTRRIKKLDKERSKLQADLEMGQDILTNQKKKELVEQIDELLKEMRKLQAMKGL